MKICICGKGGSGKSTVVALLAAAFRDRGQADPAGEDRQGGMVNLLIGFAVGAVIMAFGH